MLIINKLEVYDLYRHVKIVYNSTRLFSHCFRKNLGKNRYFGAIFLQELTKITNFFTLFFYSK